VLAVIGIGGLGAYAIQYAKLLSSGATVVAFGRNDERLAVAQQYGANHVINTTGKAIDDIRQELFHATDHHEIEAAVDCAGADARRSKRRRSATPHGGWPGTRRGGWGAVARSGG
jgi:propanol-preferring alcohol dehydrogenase